MREGTRTLKQDGIEPGYTMRDAQANAISLKDYSPPDFLFETVHLDVVCTRITRWSRPGLPSSATRRARTRMHPSRSTATNWN